MHYKAKWVRWVDSARDSNGGWVDMTDLSTDFDPGLCESLGFVIKETKEFIRLVPHIAGDNEGMGAIDIPKVAIKDSWDII